MTAQVGRTRRSDALQNRGRILAAARSAVADGGAAVPLREIARRAGVGPATVYRHFATKEALLAEAFAEQLARCSTIVDDGLAATDPWDGFRLVIERLMEAHTVRRGIPAEAITHVPDEEEISGDHDRAIRSFLTLMRRAKDAGALRPDVGLYDVSLALMANEGIRADTPEATLAAARRFAALILQSFQAQPSLTPLPPAVRVPLQRV